MLAILRQTEPVDWFLIGLGIGMVVVLYLLRKEGRS